MALEFRPIAIDQDDASEGRLVLRDDKLVAILSRLSEAHSQYAGRWFMECGFGAVSKSDKDFADLDEVDAWIRAQLA